MFRSSLGAADAAPVVFPGGDAPDVVRPGAARRLGSSCLSRCTRAEVVRTGCWRGTAGNLRSGTHGHNARTMDQAAEVLVIVALFAPSDYNRRCFAPLSAAVPGDASHCWLIKPRF